VLICGYILLNIAVVMANDILKLQKKIQDVKFSINFKVNEGENCHFIS